MRAVLVSLIAALGAAACAGPTPRQPAQTPGMGWTYYETPEEGAKLAFGRPGTDDAPLMLTCPLKTGRVTVWVDSPAEPAPRAFELVSGRAASRLSAQSEGDDPLILGRTTVADPALRAFAASGRLSVRTGAARADYPMTDPAPVRAFMKNCSG